MTPELKARLDAIEEKFKQLKRSVDANLKSIMAEMRTLNVQVGQLLQQQGATKANGG